MGMDLQSLLVLSAGIAKTLDATGIFEVLVRRLKQLLDSVAATTQQLKRLKTLQVNSIGNARLDP